MLCAFAFKHSTKVGGAVEKTSDSFTCFEQGKKSVILNIFAAKILKIKLFVKGICEKWVKLAPYFLKKMEELIKITQILNGYRIGKVDIIGNEDSESRHTEFFELLKAGKFKNDTEAAQYFYGKKATERSLAYRRFKSRFRERLINTLFFIDVTHPDFNDLESATMNIQKEWAAINILFAKGDLRLPMLLAERLLPTAIKFELTEIVVYITDRLKNSYGGQIGNIKKYTYYKWLQKEQMAIWQAEIQAKDLYQELRMHFIKSTAHKPFVAKIAQQGLEELQPACDKYKTIRLLYYVYIAKIGQYTTVNDYQTASKLCDEAVEAFRSKPFEAQRLMNSFLNQKLVCHIQLKEYKEGHTLLKEILKHQVQGTLTWFKTLEHATVLAFHTKNYQDAYETYQKVRKDKAFRTLELRHLEIWHLYSAYLHFLTAIGKVKATAKSLEIEDFKLNRFLNDVEVFGRDNAGMNISVLTVQVALQMTEGKFGKMIDSIDALTKYRQRHLSKSHSLYRHNIFIKMVTQIPRSGFNKVELRRLTDVALRNMKACPIQTDGLSFQAEIIPLEDMWELLVELVKN